MDVQLTIDQKIRILNAAVTIEANSVDKDCVKLYKKMVDLVVNYNPDKSEGVDEGKRKSA